MTTDFHERLRDRLKEIMSFHTGQPNDAFLRRRMSEWLRDGFKEFENVADFRVVCDETNNPSAMVTDEKLVRTDFYYIEILPFHLHRRHAWYAKMQLEDGKIELSETTIW